MDSLNFTFTLRITSMLHKHPTLHLPFALSLVYTSGPEVIDPAAMFVCFTWLLRYTRPQVSPLLLARYYKVLLKFLFLTLNIYFCVMQRRDIISLRMVLHCHIRTFQFSRISYQTWNGILLTHSETWLLSCVTQRNETIMSPFVATQIFETVTQDIHKIDGNVVD